MDKWFHIFTAGTYNDFPVTVQDLTQVVSSYNPQFHEAPVWLGHPGKLDEGSHEPLALAWISALRLDGSRLMAQLSSVSPDFQYLVENNYMRYCSAEFVYYQINGNETLYLFALGLTNRPAVTSLTPLTNSAAQHIINRDYANPHIFTFAYNNFSKSNSKKMNENLLKLAAVLNFDIADIKEDSDLTDALIKFIQDNQKSKDDILAGYEDQIAKFKDERALMLIKFALDSKKILPDEKVPMLKFAVIDFDSAKDYIYSKPVHSIFAKDVIKSKVPDVPDLKDPKFFAENGSPVTYEMCLKEPELLKRFTSDELSELKEKSSFKS